ncbi:Starch-binding associating with outer membrane [Chitinophaga jiangningensis]|uniref:Starch-binding associating with outer membrane n=1 Tax=Chitinophaga jiangningensis TaxID=1419482 RepID=A0A1M7FYX4_9BACT|nr:SusD/RagB family nutrient-binding outer membrane lipoprotein [Chitinophaga jiangningensis]SHM09180.1 Starch-binding associating with outer membrane [Chitinophaga jiangningensis]
MEFLIRVTIAVSILILPVACSLQDTNVNPNASTETSVSAVLTGAEVALGFNLGVNGGLIANIYIQQASGANGDAASFDNYTSSPHYFNSTWRGFYVDVLDELQIVRRTAAAQKLPYYSGIARILSTYTFGTLTDLFGDIPYKDALSGNQVTNPAFDKQEDIYADLQLQLDSAIRELSVPATENFGALPATDDVIYGGNVERWKSLAYTLKARYAIHLSKLGSTAAAQQVLNALYDGSRFRAIAENLADAQVVFGSSTTNSNPFYQQNTNRPGWIGLGASFVNLLNGNAVTDAATKPEGLLVDPRRAYFATPYPTGSSTYRGSAPGVSGAFSVIGSYYGTATSPVIISSYSEAKFLEAEARYRINPQDPLVKTALEAAIRASFVRVINNASDPYATVEKQQAYIAANVANPDLKTIITQKYIALFLQPEAWTDYRRTGYPAIPLAQNATSAANPEGKIPRRIPYPQNEVSLNRNTPEGSGYQTPALWWDK